MALPQSSVGSSSVLFAFLIVSGFLNPANSEYCPNPTNEYKSTIIPFTVPVALSTSSSFTWWARSYNKDLVTCYTDNETCTKTTDFENIITGSFSTSPSSKRLQLDVSEVNRVYPFDMETEWRLFDASRQTIYSCYLIVYKKPSDVYCNKPLFSIDNSSLSLTCHTVGVYPQGLCQFYRRSSPEGAENPLDNTRVQYSHDIYNPSPGERYSTTCTQTVPLSSLEAGAITFTVNMYPGFTGSNTSYGERLSPPVGIRLAYPNVTITSCPVVIDMADNFKSDYIREGAWFTCQCNLEHPGNPTGTIVWLNSTGHTVSTENMLPMASDHVISHPVFTINGKMRDDKIVPGDNVTVTCSDTGVIGEHIDLLCINNRVSINQDDEDKIEFLSVRTADNGTVCVCKWTSTLGCLLQGTKSLTVTSDDRDSELTFAALGVLCRVLAVAVIIAVLVIRRRRNGYTRMDVPAAKEKTRTTHQYVNVNTDKAYLDRSSAGQVMRANVNLLLLNSSNTCQLVTSRSYDLMQLRVS
ncbi:uncharacterized protein LOC101846786 [Aplysia californica]|uniref:Uncharacterized protein LOC101846786 n=1 Tax=Aplysia californica TaxID=6500 RepID=A0ABM0KAG0_APLCA|nr:uncharacterized protein LOC101846786 [Aplysia californica]